MYDAFADAIQAPIVTATGRSQDSRPTFGEGVRSIRLLPFPQ